MEDGVSRASQGVLSILNPQSSILNPQPSILNPQPPIVNPQSSTLNPLSSILYPQSFSAFGIPKKPSLRSTRARIC